MKIEAYKCEETGAIFEGVEAYESFRASLKERQRLEALRAELLPQIRALQAKPFIEAGNMAELAAALRNVYPELAALLEKAELLPDELAGNMMANAEVLKAELRPSYDNEIYEWSPYFGTEEESAEAKKGMLFELRLLFTFERALPGCPVNLMQSVFPMLNSRAYLNTDDPEPATSKYLDMYAEPFLATMPALLAKYRLFDSLPSTRAVNDEYVARLDECMLSDAVHQKFVAEENEIQADIAELERRKDKLKGHLDDIAHAKKTRRDAVASEVINEFPSLSQYWSLFADLSLC